MLTLLDRQGALDTIPPLADHEDSTRELVGVMLFHAPPTAAQLTLAEQLGFVLTDAGDVVDFHTSNQHPIYALYKEPNRPNQSLEIIKLYKQALEQGQHLETQYWVLLNEVMKEIANVDYAYVTVDDHTGKRTLSIDYYPEGKEN